MRNHHLNAEYFSDPHILKYAILFSFIVHLMFFARFSYLNRVLTHKSFRKVEVTYYNLKLQPKKEEARARKEDKAKAARKNEPVLLKKEIKTASPIKDMTKLIDNIIAPIKQPAATSEVQIKRKITVPAIKSEKIANPLYQNYYQAIRSTIKERADANYAKTDTGEVYMTFVLLADGMLKEIQLIEERTQANDYLRDISLKSIQEANPFPPFPKDLTYPELSFNVVISFEVEE